MVNSANLCEKKRRAGVSLLGQNGRRYGFRPAVRNDCPKKGKGAAQGAVRGAEFSRVSQRGVGLHQMPSSHIGACAELPVSVCRKNGLLQKELIRGWGRALENS